MTALSPRQEPLVAVCTVTHNAAADLPAFLDAIDGFSYRPLEAIVVDCASTDSTREILADAATAGQALKVIRLEENVGFAGGMNRAIEATPAPFVLSLNADALPEPDYIERLLGRFYDRPGMRIGAVTGRLHRPSNGGARVLDAAGMRLVSTWRHLDRGSNQTDVGQYDQAERVFGATGAASLFYRPALEDASVDGEFFLNEFHSFREDAELAFRLQERGWSVVFEPLARASHGRSNLPGRRRSMPMHVNFHSLKNRFLLRAYHENLATLALTFLPALGRDLAAIGYVVARERSSLSAYGWLWKHRKRIARRRRRIQSRRTVDRIEIARWFLRSSRPL